MGDPKKQKEIEATQHYFHSGSFDFQKFKAKFIEDFSKDPHFDLKCIPALQKLLASMAADDRITDIRAMAYMLATVFWETTSLKTETVPVKDSHGKQKLSKHGQPLFHRYKRWAVTMAPVAEVGHGEGRDYYLPVKIRKLADGSAHITEQDGDQFSVSLGGRIKNLSRHASMGTAPGTHASKVYKDDEGEEHAYFGRGYVQLTWWSNYAAAGIAIDRGLSLLFDPDLVFDPDIAYALMADGMIYGHGFANGYKLSDYFHGTHCDYLNARHMVNGDNEKDKIAEIAKTFQKILMSVCGKTPAKPAEPVRHVR